MQKVFFGIFCFEHPNPGADFFVYVKLLISLLNGAFFRLGENFSVRGYGARFSATDFQQLFKQMVGTPYGFCCAAGLGNFASDEKDKKDKKDKKTNRTRRTRRTRRTNRTRRRGGQEGQEGQPGQEGQEGQKGQEDKKDKKDKNAEKILP